MSADNWQLDVDVYADVSCPWCYLSHARFSSALESLGTLLPPAKVRLAVRPFFVNHAQRLLADGSERPADQKAVEQPPPADEWEDMERKEKGARVKAFVQEAGLPMKPLKTAGKGKKLPDTTDAHRLLRWLQGLHEGEPCLADADPARERGAYAERLGYGAMGKLYDLAFAEGKDVADPENLAALLPALGLPPSAAQSALAFLRSPSLRREVLEAEHEVRERGVTGVPWYDFKVVDANGGVDGDDRVLISFELVGAQDPESFARLVKRAVEKGGVQMRKRYGEGANM
ncbi:thioredoxin-like protein [Hyaloraphidium curvatum]|nr:thioredoxin-like protein [Hyaloraphidium curvatum]